MIYLVALTAVISALVPYSMHYTSGSGASYGDSLMVSAIIFFFLMIYALGGVAEAFEQKRRDKYFAILIMLAVFSGGVYQFVGGLDIARKHHIAHLENMDQFQLEHMIREAQSERLSAESEARNNKIMAELEASSLDSQAKHNKLMSDLETGRNTSSRQVEVALKDLGVIAEKSKDNYIKGRN